MLFGRISNEDMGRVLVEAAKKVTGPASTALSKLEVIHDRRAIAGDLKFELPGKNSLRVDSSFGFIPIVRKLSAEGRLDKALRTVDHMHQRGICIPTNTFYYLLQGCIDRKDLVAGREVHCRILRGGLESNPFLGCHLIRMFASCGSLSEANDSFRKLHEPSLFAWSAIISAHANFGDGEQAIELYHQMQQTGLKPGEYAFVAVLKACSATANVHEGKLIHAHIIESGIELHIFVANTLIDMYCKCGHLQDASRVFNNMEERDVVTWSSLITGHAQHNDGLEALNLFHQMQHEGVKPNPVTFVSILKACSSMPALDKGRLVHIQIIQCGCDLDVFVGGALIDMYAKCGNLDDARTMFDNNSKRTVVTWSAMISGYAQHGDIVEALLLYEKMQQEGIQLNNVTFSIMLKVCSSMGAFDQGKLIHGHIIASGCGLDINMGNTLIDMYAKCSSLDDAQIVFNSLPHSHVVTWNAMIMAFVEHGCGQEGLRLFQQMELEAMDPDNVTFISLLKACSCTTAVNEGKLIHVHILDHGCELDSSVGNALIDMYAKCSSLQDAHWVFNSLSRRDVVAWSAMIMGYALHNNYKLALQYFQDMQLEGLKPNVTVFARLLSACAHVGLMNEGCNHLSLMIEHSGISPTHGHYNCLVDLLGRIGHLNFAEDLLKTMPYGSSIMGWTSLLNHCRIHGNVELGSRCFDHVNAIDGRPASGFVLMSKIYSDADMLDDVDEVYEMGKCAHLWKNPGKALIEFENKVHDFIIGDRSHLQSDELYGKLDTLSVLLREDGYVPHFDV